jgi:septal ring factor EnvC (AmiA/AmiB activator)
MLKKLFVCIILCSTLWVCSYGQQTRAEIQQEQKSLQKELNELNETLSQVRQTRKLSLRELNLLEKKIKARQSLIESINDEMQDLNTKITNYNAEVQTNKKQLDTLTTKYAESLVFAYKNRSKYNYINFLFSSNTFNEALRRVAYLKSYRAYRETQADNIKKAQAALRANIAKLESTKSEKRIAAGQQNSQLTALQSDRNEKDSAISDLKSREGEIGKEIAVNAAKRRKLQEVLRQVIRREIQEAERKERERQQRIAKAKEEEERRARIAEQQRVLKERQDQLARDKAAADAAAAKKANAATAANDKVANAKVENNTPPANAASAADNSTASADAPKKIREEQKPEENPQRMGRSYNVLESTEKTLTQSLDFEKDRGHLPWPVTGGFISGAYGVQSIPGTSLKEVNDGIEITATGGNITVKSVASGTVSVVISDETYAVIVRHGKYFTTYSNLKDVTVQKGDEVKAGTIVGHMATGISGVSTVFFMVTDSQGNPLNPMTWISGR